MQLTKIDATSTHAFLLTALMTMHSRSCAGLVRSCTDLVSPPSNMTQPSTSILSSWGPLFIMSQKASHTPVTVTRPGESQNPAVAKPPSSLS